MGTMASDNKNKQQYLKRKKIEVKTEGTYLETTIIFHSFILATASEIVMAR